MKNKMQQMPFFMCIGLSGGMALGAALGSIPIGMCLGLAIGMCLGVAVDARKLRETDDAFETEEPFVEDETEENEDENEPSEE